MRLHVCCMGETLARPAETEIVAAHALMGAEATIVPKVVFEVEKALVAPRLTLQEYIELGEAMLLVEEIWALLLVVPSLSPSFVPICQQEPPLDSALVSLSSSGLEVLLAPGLASEAAEALLEVQAHRRLSQCSLLAQSHTLPSVQPASSRDLRYHIPLVLHLRETTAPRLSASSNRKALSPCELARPR